MFSVVRSCSRNTLIATSVPFHIPRKTSPKNPIPTLVPIVSSEKSMFHSSKGNKGLLRNGELCKTLFHANTIFSLLTKSQGLIVSEICALYS
ncbi:Os01g0674125 [Oryza sativa Japonica Group]|uniref:Os01g0674125 protein n=1 Tax=Oryza sativa subsp. japonica TaxID=39947 RepID=A0A0N7KDH6_ORYSJ|nr:hypothetical protein EE612_004936 [Oryza sativa]BAS73641.1 Os01g0674125 [Oryza sativa Japonica Group]